jgi:hypothetical protein
MLTRHERQGARFLQVVTRSRVIFTSTNYRQYDNRRLNLSESRTTFARVSYSCRLLMPERDHRIDMHGLPRGQITCE